MGHREQVDLDQEPSLGEVLDIGDDERVPDSGALHEPPSHQQLARLMSRAEIMVGAGAIAGVIARFTISTLAKQYLPGTLPFGTLLINLAGCLLIGIFQTLFLDLAAMRRETQLLLSVGLCGGFTTFSTFSVETVQMLQAGHASAALAYQALSLGGGLLAVLGGVALAREAHGALEHHRGRSR